MHSFLIFLIINSSLPGIMTSHIPPEGSIMKRNDSLTLWTATVDRSKVRFKSIKHLGIEFSNEIDAWSKMEFIYRRKITALRSTGTFGAREIFKDGKSLVYSIREKVDF